MKTRLFPFFLTVATWAGFSSGFAQAKIEPTAKAVGAPKIQFEATTFDFGRVKSGELVKHQFVFTNTGTATLEITDVHPGCGCTTAGAWDKTVEPGKTGTIPLQFNSTGYSSMVSKQTTVTCNDPSQPTLTLMLTGSIWKPIDVIPTMAFFNYTSEAQNKETKVVRIVSNLDEPLTLAEPVCTNQSFHAELKTVKAGKEFELHVTALPPFSSAYVQVPITIKTSSTNNPSIDVIAYASVQPAVLVTPSQFMVTAGPLTNVTKAIVTIRSNGTNAITLTDAQINVPGAEIKVQEIQAGHLFNLTASFPVGFQMVPPQTYEATVKSSHPKFPIIKVPVYQQARLPGFGQPAAIHPATLNVGAPATTRAVPNRASGPVAAGK